MFGRRENGASRRNLREAFRALRALMLNPNDTAEGFRLIEALDPLIHHRELARMQTEPSGQRLLREQPVLLQLLRARDALDALPAGSLAREYRAFCAREGVGPDAFVSLGEAASQSIDDDLVRYAAHRSRDSHDLWHVVCGYRSDLAGEAGILGFTLAQTRSPGMLLLFFGGLLQSLMIGYRQGKTMRRLAFFGLKNGLRARPLAAAPWEEWLDKPLDEVRAQLRIFDVPSYEPAYAVPR